jgi:hypothetical protein
MQFLFTGVFRSGPNASQTMDVLPDRWCADGHFRVDHFQDAQVAH